jgi:uncharacterized membrane protein YfcA
LRPVRAASYIVDNLDRQKVVGPADEDWAMEFDWGMSVAGLIVGFIIGLTGMGGGALMTPILVIFFNINPTAAVSSDVIASLVLKPVGGGVHIRKGTVNWRLVKWLMVGSIPTAFLGAYLIDDVFGGEDAAGTVKKLLGWVLLVAASAIVAKTLITARRKNGGTGEMMDQSLVRPVPTLVIGALGGLIVGLTSVGSGSLIIVMLMLLYPKLSSREMVGTDLVQAIPLIGSAALGHALFGSPEVDVIVPVLIGAVPAVWVGAHVSSRAADHWIRPVLVGVLSISALKLLEPTKGAFNGLLLGLSAVMLVGYGTYVYLTLRRTRAAEDQARATSSMATERITSPTDTPSATSIPSVT